MNELAEITRFFTELYESNKYLIKIYNTVDNKWCIFMFKNQHIQLDVQTLNSLTSEKIDIKTVIEYIDNQPSDIKIAYTCHYDDFEEYKKKLQDILEKIKTYYGNRGKIIHLKYRVYWI